MTAETMIPTAPRGTPTGLTTRATADLVARALGGSEQAFDALYAETVRELTAWVAYRSYRWDMVDECVQATFVTAHRSLARFDPDRSLAAWLKGIARNEIMKYLERRQRVQRDRDATLAALQLERLTTLDTADDDELSPRLAGCLDQLGDRARELVWRRYVDGAAVEEMAADEGRSPNAISVALHRSRQALRRCLGGRGA